jgi:hypothetical protein
MVRQAVSNADYEPRQIDRYRMFYALSPRSFSTVCPAGKLASRPALDY